MTEETTDMIGQIFWFLMFVTPLITFPWVWRFYKVQLIYRIIIGLVLACLLSFLLYLISLAIIFRNGIGPG